MSNIVRVFRAKTKPGKAEAFRAFFVDEAVLILRGFDGLVSVQVGLPTEASPDTFMMTTTWSSLDAMKAFTGENWQTPVIDEREAPLLERDEVTVEHYLEASI